ncbi:MAG TPA: hypothetical protein V6D10_21810 [Trichocoleus sp.]
MGTLPKLVSSCRHCQFYRVEGRRGGHCQQLSVPVQGQWQACSLAIPPFSTASPTATEILALQQSLELENTPSPVFALPEGCIKELTLSVSVSAHNIAS